MNEFKCHSIGTKLRNFVPLQFRLKTYLVPTKRKKENSVCQKTHLNREKIFKMHAMHKQMAQAEAQGAYEGLN